MVRLRHSGDEERLDIVQSACPGPGACGGMYTANTMVRRRSKRATRATACQACQA